MTIQNGCIRFNMNIIKQDKVKLLKRKISRDDEYCFDVTFNGIKKENYGFKTISANISEGVGMYFNHYGDKIWKFEAKVSLKLNIFSYILIVEYHKFY